MGSAAGAGNDGTQAALRRCLRVGEHFVGHAVGRNHARLEADAKLLENINRMLHGVPIRTGTHHHANLYIFHPRILRFHPEPAP